MTLSIDIVIDHPRLSAQIRYDPTTLSPEVCLAIGALVDAATQLVTVEATIVAEDPTDWAIPAAVHEGLGENGEAVEPDPDPDIEVDGPERCRWCGREFGTVQAMRVHISRKHRDEAGLAAPVREQRAIERAADDPLDRPPAGGRTACPNACGWVGMPGRRTESHLKRCPLA